MCKGKFKNFIFKPFFALLSIVSVITMSSVVYMDNVLPDEYNVFEGENLKLTSKIPVKAVVSGEKTSGAQLVNTADKKYSVELKALGIIPVKQASVSVISDNDVYVPGKPFGIKIYTDGVMVVGIDSVATEKGNVTPATDAGLKEGDLIVSINGQKVYSNEEVAEIIEVSGGMPLKFKIVRDNKEQTIKITPALCYQSGKYKTGIWVRDSSAGIGTLTFYSPSAGIICGLGHGICDVDTGELLTLNSGELVEAEILAVEKGTGGDPGELMGKFKENSIGELVLNNETGVYAECQMECDKNSLVKMALKQEVRTGNAQIYTTVDGDEPAFYDCTIEKIAHNDSVTKNMVIRVTDQKLIDKTGGIVQGMSGSPIFQNGKLVGAITHVFLDDPTGGYAIFAENMLSSAQSAAKQNLKDAS